MEIALTVPDWLVILFMIMIVASTVANFTSAYYKWKVIQLHRRDNG